MDKIQPLPSAEDGRPESLAQSYNWLVFRVEAPLIRAAARNHARGRLADIGCGDKPYAQFLAPYIEQHIGIDHADTPHDAAKADILGSAYDTTLPAASVDTVWCTAVLEHLERPLDALCEASRILKPHGKAIYTTPLFWPLHEEPRDFFRYTRYGLAYLFEQAGFRVIEIIPQSGFVVTFAQLACYWLRGHRRGWRRLLVDPAIQALQHAAYALRRWDRSPHFTYAYLVVAQKLPTASRQRT